MKRLLKELMNDPEYRGMMIEVFKEPEIQKELADALKSKEYREHLQKVITETVDSPLFKVKMQEIAFKSSGRHEKQRQAAVKEDQGDSKSDSRKATAWLLDSK